MIATPNAEHRVFRPEAALRALISETTLRQNGFTVATAIDAFDARLMILGMYQYMQPGGRTFDRDGVQSDSSFVACLAGSGLLGKVFLMPTHLGEFRTMVHNRFGQGGSERTDHVEAAKLLLDYMPKLAGIVRGLESGEDEEQLVDRFIDLLERDDAVSECFRFLEMTDCRWERRISGLSKMSILDLTLAEHMPFEPAIRSKEFQILKDSFNAHWRKASHLSHSNFVDALAVATLLKHIQRVNRGESKQIVYFYSGTKGLVDHVLRTSIADELVYRIGDETIPAVVDSHFLRLRASFLGHVDDTSTPEDLEEVKSAMLGLAFTSQTGPETGANGHVGPGLASFYPQLQDYDELRFLQSALIPRMREKLLRNRKRADKDSTLGLILPVPEDQYDDFLDDLDRQISDRMHDVIVLTTRIGKFELSLSAMVKGLKTRNDVLLPIFGAGLMDTVQLQHLFLSAAQIASVKARLDRALNETTLELETLASECSIAYLDLYYLSGDSEFKAYDELFALTGFLWILEGKEADRIALDLLLRVLRLDLARFQVWVQLVAFGHRVEHDMLDGPYETAYARLEAAHTKSRPEERPILSIALAYVLHRRSQLKGFGIDAVYDPVIVEKAIELAREAYKALPKGRLRLYALNQIVFYRVQSLLGTVVENGFVKMDPHRHAELRDEVRELQAESTRILDTASPLYQDTVVRGECVLWASSTNSKTRSEYRKFALDLLAALPPVTLTRRQQEVHSLFLALQNWE